MPPWGALLSSARLPLPGVSSDVASDLETWANASALTELVAAFGGDSANFPTGRAARLDALDKFSDLWDYRQGRERDQVREMEFSPQQSAAIDLAINALGLRESAPPKFHSYDHVIALGGLIRACFVRPEFAARLIREGIVATNSFVALGGFRPFSEEEAELALAANLHDLSNEYDALDAGTRAAFGLVAPQSEYGVSTPATVGGSWAVREYEFSPSTSVTVAAAPSTDPAIRRANTADTYEWMAKELIRLEVGARVLAITTSIYVPAQQATAVRMLGIPFGVDVDTVGSPSERQAGPWTQSFSEIRYLLEIRSAIRAMRELSVLVKG